MPERFIKHNKSQDHGITMTNWIAFSENIRRKTSLGKQIDNKGREKVKWNREQLRVLIECLVFTAQPYYSTERALWRPTWYRFTSDINRKNFLELLHMRCRIYHDYKINYSQFKLTIQTSSTTDFLEISKRIIADYFWFDTRTNSNWNCWYYVFNRHRRN